MSHKSSEWVRVMSSTAEASSLLRRIAAPTEADGSVKAALQRAHRKLSTWSFNRVRDVFHADPRIRISAEEMDQLRAATRANEETDARDELLQIQARLAALEAALNATDEDFHRPQIDALRRLFTQSRAGRRPLAED
jgi:hypothetical protein